MNWILLLGFFIGAIQFHGAMIDHDRMLQSFHQLRLEVHRHPRAAITKHCAQQSAKRCGTELLWRVQGKMVPICGHILPPLLGPRWYQVVGACHSFLGPARWQWARVQTFIKT